MCGRLGVAKFGMARRAEIFISYQWGRAMPPTADDGQPYRRRRGRWQQPVFETQQLVVSLKGLLERETRLTCWCVSNEECHQVLLLAPRIYQQLLIHQFAIAAADCCCS